MLGRAFVDMFGYRKSQSAVYISGCMPWCVCAYCLDSIWGSGGGGVRSNSVTVHIHNKKKNCVS